VIHTSSYREISPASGDREHVLFGQTMGYVAATAGFFTLGAYLGRNLSSGWAFAGYIAGCGAAGYATRRDLSALGRACFWALIALIVFGIVLIFIHIPVLPADLLKE
jgi:FtsH-binding integral membrane protein